MVINIYISDGVNMSIGDPFQNPAHFDWRSKRDKIEEKRRTNNWPGHNS